MRWQLIKKSPYHWVTSLFAIFALLALQPAMPAHAAEKKTLKIAFRAAETGFDPQKIEDRYSVGICENIFDSLITYDWLARPVKLVPQIVEAVPVGEEGGTRFTFRIRPGIYFSDDPIFKGKRRELVARDMEYAIKRFRDPANRSPYSWLFEDRVVGLDEFVAAAKKSGTYDYDVPVAGLKVVDKYTISFKLKEPDYTFIYFFAMPNVVPVAREAIEGYASDTMGHPIGTGPYVLKEWVRRSKIVLEKNPNYRGHVLDAQYADPADPWDQEAIKYLGRKTLPLIDRIEISPIEEEQPRFLAFMNREHEYIEETPFAFVAQLLPNGKLSPEMQKRNMRVFREEAPETTWDAFNLEDTVVGGYQSQNVGFRRALVLAHDREQEIAIIRRGQALAAQSPVPPGIIGFDSTFHAIEQEYNPARAKALLDMFGYIDKDGDGWRDLPDGRPLKLTYKYRANEESARQQAELWAKCLADVGIRMEAIAVQFADLLKDRKVGKYQMSGIAWTADYPDAQNFLQLLYGPNTNISNDSRFKLPEYDRLYTQALKLPDSPERDKLYHEMNRIIVAYAPWRFGVHRVFSHFINQWVLGYKKHPILFTSFKYLDIDAAAQKAVMQQ